MARRLLDALLALIALVLAAPVLALAAIGIKLTSQGPVLFRTRRVGRDGRQFVMLKLRTMHLDHGGVKSRITGVADPRIFPFGRLLRKSKIDELPQLVNIVKGDMAIVGPRPEVPGVVARHYAPLHRETLNVRPGLTSPGSIYHYTIGENALTGPDTEARYFEDVLPTKLALDVLYVRKATLGYDVAIIARTLVTIVQILAGRREFKAPFELNEARGFIVPARNARIYVPAIRSTDVPASPSTAPVRPAAGLALGLLVLALSGCMQTESPPIVVQWGGASSDMLSPEDDPAIYQPVFLVGAGNTDCDSHLARETAKLLDRIPGAVFTTGDHASCTTRAWGRHASRIRPVAGESEFRGGKGWYSYSVGTWHVIALNSAADMGEGSEQLAWLRQDLAASYGACTVAIWHQPRFASGRGHGDSAGTQAVWDALYASGVEIVLNGHEQHYERFAPQAPDGTADWEHGVRQFIIGTGGESNGLFGITETNSERRRSGTAGVLVLELLDGTYDWHFVPVSGDAFTDGGSGSCHAAPPWAPRPARRASHTIASTGPGTVQP